VLFQAILPLVGLYPDALHYTDGVRSITRVYPQLKVIDGKFGETDRKTRKNKLKENFF